MNKPSFFGWDFCSDEIPQKPYLRVFMLSLHDSTNAVVEDVPRPIIVGFFIGDKCVKVSQPYRNYMAAYDAFKDTEYYYDFATSPTELWHDFIGALQSGQS